MQTTTLAPTTPQTVKDTDPRLLRKVRRAINKTGFAVLATTSPAGRPHAAGVIYEVVDGDLWIHTDRPSRKGRNLTANPHVALTLAFRRLPVGPPFTVHFQAEAEIVPVDDPRATRHLEAGRLTKISGHGALDRPDGVFVRIRPKPAVHTFGVGVPILDMARDPLSGGRSVRLDADGGWL